VKDEGEELSCGGARWLAGPVSSGFLLVSDWPNILYNVGQGKVGYSKDHLLTKSTLV